MKLEDLEALDKARTPARWEAEIDCVDVGWVAIGPAHPVGGDAGPTEAMADAAFIAACSEMVPKLIQIAKLSRLELEKVPEKYLSADAKVMLSIFADLEQP